MTPIRQTARRLRRACGGVVTILALGACTGESPTTVIVGGPPSGFTQLVVGPRFACALNPSGRSYCWGAGDLGGLGDGRRQSSAQPVLVLAQGVAFRRISVGYAHACGVAAGGDAWCWGWGVLGQLGIGGPTVGGPYAVAGPPLEAVSSGWYHNCGIAQDGSAWCWGSNAKGQLGDGTRIDRYAPVPVLGGLRFRSLSAGGTHTCGIAYDGAAYCWGLNASGQLGTGTTVDAPTPRPVVGAVRFRLVRAGYQHTCGLTDAGVAQCWGSDVRGELGRGDVVPEGLPGSTIPDSVRTVLRFAELDAGYARSCGVTADGAAYCWGAGESAELGTGVEGDEALPAVVIRPVVDSAALRYAFVGASGVAYGCALTQSGDVYCWGRGDEGQLGTALLTRSPQPIRVVTGAQPALAAIGWR